MWWISIYAQYYVYNDISWTQNRYFQHSCIVTGNGYPGEFCCEATECTRTITSYSPSGTPSTSSSHFPIPFLSQKHTIADSWAPSQHPYFDPSHIPSNTPTISTLQCHFGSLLWIQAIIFYRYCYFRKSNHQKDLALLLPIHKLFQTNRAYANIAQTMNLQILKILMKSVVNQYLLFI